MRPVEPSTDCEALNVTVRRVVFGESQEEYNNLPALVTDAGVAISEWEFTEEERKLIAEGENLKFIIYGRPFRPVVLRLGQVEPEDVAAGDAGSFDESREGVGRV